MAGLDYLFSGVAPETMSAQTASNGLPDWYNQYVQGIGAKAVNTAANQGSQPVPQRSVAGLNPDQLNAFQGIRNLQGGWQTPLNYAADQMMGAQQNASNVQSALAGAGQGALGDFMDFGIRGVDKMLGAGQGALGQLSAAGQGALTGMTSSANNAAGMANNLAGTAVGQANAGATGAANQANNAVAGPSRNWIDAGTMQQYMSPYTSAVVNEIARLGNKNFSETVMPQIQSAMLGSGQFGSTRNASALGTAAVNNQQNILGQQAQSLESGYTTAGNLFNQDANRHQQQQQMQADTALQGGQLVSNTALQGGQLGANTALTGGQLQQSALQAGHNANINALGTGHQLNIGALANAGNFGLDALKSGHTLNQNALLQGGQLGVNTALSAADKGGQFAQLYQQLGLNDNAALQAIGQQQQNQQQLGYDTAYANQVAANNWDWDTLNKLSSVLRGQQLPTSSVQSGTTSTTPYQQAPLTSLYSGLAGLAGG